MEDREMEFSLLVFAVVFSSNVVALFVMYMLQQTDYSLPPRNSIIPGTRQKFLYMQDFWTMSVGDIFGVPFVINALVMVTLAGKFTFAQWGIFTVVAIGSGVGFLNVCLSKNHKPDWGYPTIGTVSLGGIAHVVYFGVCIAASVLVVWHIFVDIHGALLYTTLAGGAVYIATFVADQFLTGNFDPLKMDLHDPDPEHERQKNLEACC